jgi:uncharacterized membrane protein YbhN (UPF0104 family)
MKKLLSYIKHLAPWCIAVAIFAYLFHLYPPAEVWRALQHVNIPIFTLFAIGYFVFIFLVDSWVMQRVITQFSKPVKFKDIFQARGATYLVMIINYPASQAAFAYYLKRRYGIPIFEALGIFLFIILIDLIWIISLAFAGSFFQTYEVAGVPLGPIVQKVAIGAYAFLFLWIAFWGRWIEKLSGKKLHFAFLEKIRARKAFHIFNQAKAFDYLKVAGMRTPIHLTIIISMYVVINTFHASIPFVKILGNVPLVFFIGTLPITPGGLGTTNAAMVELLSPYLTGPIFASGSVTPKSLLFTATLLWMFGNYLMKVIFGTFFLRRVSGDLFRPTKDVPEEKAEHEAAHIGGNL